MGLKNALVGLLLAAPVALAHPGHVEVAQQHRAMPLKRKGLGHCNKRFSDEEFVKRTLKLHGEEFARLRRNLGFDNEPKLYERDYIEVSQIDHKQDIEVTLDADPAQLFTETGACMLMPSVDQGPLYVLGEEVRKEIHEGQAGIPMTLAIQVVDYNTCDVVPNAHLDIWSSNSTGQYVGVQGYPGMGDPNDDTILMKTAMRGVQPADEDGIAVFDTVMPGHYEGRATHIHAIVWLDATKNENNTISGGRAAHVGQIYFDQSLLTGVDQVAPYNTNNMAVVPNVQDALFQAGANGDDPIVRYALVGDKLEDGIYAWIRFGVNTADDQPVNPATFWTAEGGVMNPNGPIAMMFGQGGMGGFPGFPGFGGMKKKLARWLGQGNE